VRIMIPVEVGSQQPLWRPENDIRLDSASYGCHGRRDPFGVLKLGSRPWLYNLDSDPGGW
jgi:hypothetical protein